MKKKGVMNQIINIFILVLVISVLAGMTFLFVNSLKENTADLTRTTGTKTNETLAFINTTGYHLKDATKLEFKGARITAIWNVSAYAGGHYNQSIPIGNTSVSSAGIVTNASTFTYTNVSISYAYEYIPTEKEKAYLGVNKTEAAGYNVTKYLTLLFLALIFGAILVVVLRVILPYINVGRSMGENQF